MSRVRYVFMDGYGTSCRSISLLQTGRHLWILTFYSLRLFVLEWHDFFLSIPTIITDCHWSHTLWNSDQEYKMCTYPDTWDTFFFVLVGLLISFQLTSFIWWRQQVCRFSQRSQRNLHVCFFVEDLWGILHIYYSRQQTK